MKFIKNLLRKINFKGKGRLVKIIFPKPFVGLVPYRDSLIWIDTSNMIDWNIYWFGGYEDDINWVLPFFVKNNSTCIDIGANLGVYTLLLAKSANKVISIEPHPEFREHLNRNIEINLLKNVLVHGFAVARKPGYATLYAPDKFTSNKTATLKNIKEYFPQQSEEIQVELKTLDSICENESQIDFIKIDCDWADADIILSGSEIIRKHKPVILFEDLGSFPLNWNKSEDVHDDYIEAYKMLKELGYKIFKVENHKLLDEERRLGVVQNMLAIPCGMEN